MPAALAPGNYYVLVQVDSLYQCPTPTGPTTRWPPRPASSTSAFRPDARHALCRFLHRRRSGPLLPGHRAGRRIAGRVAAQCRLFRGDWRSTSARGPCPRLYNYQEAAAIANQPNQTVVVPQVLTAGTYYILAHSVSGAPPRPATRSPPPRPAAVTVSAISPYSGGNAGNVTIEIDGTNFTPPPRPA